MLVYEVSFEKGRYLGMASVHGTFDKAELGSPSPTSLLSFVDHDENQRPIQAVAANHAPFKESLSENRKPMSRAQQGREAHQTA